MLAAIALGVVFGFLDPARAAAMKPLGDGFIKLVKMLIAPIVFTTVVVGIAQMGAMKEVGRIGLRALIYFEVTTVLALAIGLVVVDVMQPGRGVGFDPGDRRPERGRRVHRRRAAAAGHRRVPAQHHSGHRRRRASRGETCCRCCCSRCSSAWRCCKMGPRAAPLVELIATASDALFASSA